MAETITPLSELFESGEASAWEDHIFQAACAWGKDQPEAHQSQRPKSVTLVDHISGTTPTSSPTG